MPAALNLVCLAELEVGAVARFHEAQLDSEACQLLRTLGLTKSSLVRVCKAGEPCIVQVRSTRIGLAQSVARSIFVVREPSSKH